MEQERKKSTLSKRQRIAIGVALLGVLATTTTITGVTLAGYSTSTEISQTAGVKRYVFLNVSADLGSGQRWSDSRAKFYLLAYKVENSEISEYELFSSSASTVNGNYYFYVPNIYPYCKFVRANPSAAPSAVERDAVLGQTNDNVWNLTGEATFATGSNNTNANNTYTIAGWNSGSFPS